MPPKYIPIQYICTYRIRIYSIIYLYLQIYGIRIYKYKYIGSEYIRKYNLVRGE